MNRLELLKHYVDKSKTVLDLGGLGFSDDAKKYLNYIKNNSKDYLCVDIQKDVADEFKKKGYKTKVANAEVFLSTKKYDVIHAGELIEHLTNPGMFMTACMNNLEPGGILIITTPNAYSLRNLFSFFTRGREMAVREHVCLYSYTTMKIFLETCGISESVSRVGYCDGFTKGKKEQIEYQVGKMIPHVSRTIFATILKLHKK